MTAISTAKEVGRKILSTKIFWYFVVAIIGFLVIKRLINGRTPDEVILPEADTSPNATQQWYDNSGRPTMLELQAALQNEYFPASKRRLNAYLKLLAYDKHQLTIIYNTFNKNYSSQYYKGKTMTQVIDGQYTFETAQETLVTKLISYNLG